MADITGQPAQHRETSRAWRDVYILAGMRGLSVAGDILAETALVLLLQKNGAGGYAVMALLLAGTIPPILLAPVAGSFADRFSSRNIIVVVGLVQALVCVAMTRTHSPIVLVGLLVILSAGLGFTQPIFGGLPSAIVGRESIPRASAISQTTAMAGMVAAPAVAGFLSARSGATLPLLFDAVSFAIVVLGGLAIRTRLHKSLAAAMPGDAVKPADAPYRVWSDRFLRSVLILSGAVMACACISNVIVVFYVRGTFGASAQVFGLIMSSWMVGMVPGALLVRRIKRVSHEVILIASFLCLGIGILGAGLAPGVWWVVPFYVIGGLGNGAQATITHILFNLRVPHSHRGRAFAALGAVSNTGPAAGFVVGGILLSLVTPRFAFIISGGFVFVALLAFVNGVLRPAERDPAGMPGADAQPRATAAQKIV